MVALPSLSTKMGSKSRNRSPYRTKMPGAINGQRNRRKVSGYQKRTQARRIYPTKRINGISFQNHQSDPNRYLSSIPSNQNLNHLVPNHDRFSVPGRRGFGSFDQNIPQSIGSKGYPGHNNYNVPGNMSQQPHQHIGNATSYNPKFTVDSSSLEGNFTTPSQNYFTWNGVQSHPINKYADHSQNIPPPVPFAPESGFQINAETTKLLLSLDRKLIDLVSGKNSEIPPPQLNDTASLKLRRQNVIDALYNKEDKQCPNCGLRFSKEEKESFENHLDDHYRLNAERNRTKRGEVFNRRKWYPDFAKFKSSEVKTNGCTKKNEPEEKIPMIAIDNIILGINNDIVKCSLCREEFDQVFINDQDLMYKSNLQLEGLKEGWYLKNATWSYNSDVVHPTCLNE